ncbi:sortase A [Alkalihalobacillus xiaoxiensis]|uniref:Sortase A n=1 Tax=Shouchella xiaoxiensis TaxID=766895 RepID=A0ABS2SQB5_9BACI|nr:class D sortase [Shouchella xiaoxiensis]MBM7837361.1 sortase A [Shouchella xiaoxiensis]
MKKLYNACILLGLGIALFFSFQWWQGTQAVEHVTEPNDETLAKATSNEDAPSEDDPSLNEKSISEEVDIAIPETTPITNDLEDQFEVGEGMGRLYIPKLESAYETFWGTDDRTLKQGVGMYVSEWTTTPDQKGHTVLSGHRDTVFSELGDLEVGDRMFVDYDGKAYEYEIEDIWITDLEDRTVIVRKEEATLTLTTCYPFEFLGSAPDRYIIQSKLVSIR